MAVSERAKRSLRELGLTKYESTAYQFLLLSEPTAASQICKATGLRVEKALDDNADQLLDELQLLYSQKEVQERPDTWIILGGKFNILARIREMLGETERELMIAATILPRAFYERSSLNCFGYKGGAPL